MMQRSASQRRPNQRPHEHYNLKSMSGEQQQRGLRCIDRSMSTRVHPLGYVAGCVLPTSLGLWKSEYGVSYGYGGAILLAALQVLPEATSGLAVAHSLALILYGLRLCSFLAYREIFIPKFRDFREKIEKKAEAKGGRLKRVPFILSCSVLYGCMAAPLLLTAQAGFASNLMATISIALMYVGLLTAATGDFVKTWVKNNKGPDHLVTSGPFGLLRHPNYTGETLLWTSNVATGLLGLLAGGLSWQRGGEFGASVLGLLGIGFVLAQAATGLEKKQMEKYGEDAAYQAWVKRTWAGFTLPPKKKET